jgi:hypothetical protein
LREARAFVFVSFLLVARAISGYPPGGYFVA